MAGDKEDIVEKRASIVNELVEEGARLTEEKYGSGVGDGLEPLAYHNSVHVRNVVNAASEIAKLAIERGNMSIEEAQLVMIAASFHDVEQSLAGGLNERESAKIAKQKMKDKGIFTEEEMYRVGTAIMATVTIVEDGRLIQSPTDEFMTKVICDADLAGFGKPFDVYWDGTVKVFKELERRNSFSEQDIRRISTLEIGILENHKFYTAEAELLFSQRRQNIDHLRQLADS